MLPGSQLSTYNSSCKGYIANHGYLNSHMHMSTHGHAHTIENKIRLKQPSSTKVVQAAVPLTTGICDYDNYFISRFVFLFPMGYLCVALSVLELAL